MSATTASNLHNGLLQTFIFNFAKDYSTLCVFYKYKVFLLPKGKSSEVIRGLV